MLRPRLALLSAVLGLATAPAALAGTPLPPANEYFPECSDARPAFCIETFAVDADRDGTFEAPPADVEARVRLFTAFTDRDTVDAILVPVGTFPGGGAGLPESVPAGTPVRLVVRTGSWEPPPVLNGWIDVLSYARTTDAQVGWRVAVDLAPVAITVGQNCSLDDGCPSPTNVVTEPRRASFQLQGPNMEQLDALPPSDREYNLAIWRTLTGFGYGTNASTWGTPPSLDPATGAITLFIAAPHLTESGEVNQGFVSMILPDTMVRGWWGADPAVLAGSTALTAVRRDATETTTTAVAVTRFDGGVRVRIDGFHYSAPRITLRPRRLLPAPRRIGVVSGKRGTRRAIVRVAKVTGATRYEARCTRSGRTVVGRSRTRMVIVRGLRPGTWRCSARGARVIAGKWSATRSVRVR